jgi:hypothetical protein
MREYGNYLTARQATDDSIIGSMRIACRLNKTTDKHSEYVILFASLPKIFIRSPSRLAYTYIAPLDEVI